MVLSQRARHPIAVLLQPVCVELPALQPILLFPRPVVLPNTVPKLVRVAGDTVPPTPAEFNAATVEVSTDVIFVKPRESVTTVVP